MRTRNRRDIGRPSMTIQTVCAVVIELRTVELTEHFSLRPLPGMSGGRLVKVSTLAPKSVFLPARYCKKMTATILLANLHYISNRVTAHDLALRLQPDFARARSHYRTLQYRVLPILVSNLTLMST